MNDEEQGFTLVPEKIDALPLDVELVNKRFIPGQQERCARGEYRDKDGTIYYRFIFPDTDRADEFYRMYPEVE